MRNSPGANSAGQRPYALPFVCLLIHLCSYWASHQAMNGLGKGCPNGNCTQLRSGMAIDEYEQHLRAIPCELDLASSASVVVVRQ
eukprot:gene16595-biopygen7171